jgi:hypothetical protein
MSMKDDKLADEEARRAAQHGAVKSDVEGEVQAEISAHADRAAQTEVQETKKVAEEFRGKAVEQIRETEHEVGRARLMARISQVVDYLFYVLYAFLAMRLVLALLAARSTAGFVQFVVRVSNPFYGPFRDIVASPTTEGGHTLLLPLLIAIIAYALLHLGINGLLRIFAHRKTAV